MFEKMATVRKMRNPMVMPSVHGGVSFFGPTLKQPKARHPSTASASMASAPVHLSHHRQKEQQRKPVSPRCSYLVE